MITDEQKITQQKNKNCLMCMLIFWSESNNERTFPTLLKKKYKYK